MITDAPNRGRRLNVQTLHLMLTVGLAVAVGYLAGRGEGPSGVALAQTAPGAGARGVYAFSGPIENNRYGLFMLDIEQGTVWCYEFDKDEAGARKLKLSAARSWLFDRYLKNFNCAGYSPKEVEDLVALERANLAAGAESRGGTSSEKPTTGSEKTPN